MMFLLIVGFGWDQMCSYSLSMPQILFSFSSLMALEANRLKGVLSKCIFENQYVFILGRSILYNILVAF